MIIILTYFPRSNLHNVTNGSFRTSSEMRVKAFDINIQFLGLKSKWSPKDTFEQKSPQTLKLGYH